MENGLGTFSNLRRRRRRRVPTGDHKAKTQNHKK
jgi:hypothetical protein